MKLDIIKSLTTEEVLISIERSTSATGLMEIVEGVVGTISETVKAIEAIAEVVVFEYIQTWDGETGTFTMKEVKQVIAAGKIIEKYRAEEGMTDVYDPVADGLGREKGEGKGKKTFTVETYNDLKSASHAIYERCCAWNIILEGVDINDKIKIMLKGYASNLLTIAVNMKNILGKLQSQTSRLEAVNAEYRQIHAIIAKTNKDLGVVNKASFAIVSVTFIDTPSKIIVNDSLLEQLGNILKNGDNGWGNYSLTLLHSRTQGQSFDAASFDNAVRGKSKVLTIMQSTEGHVFGGYFEDTFGSPGSFIPGSPNNYIFALGNKTGQPIKLFRTTGNSIHIASCGLHMGDNNDLKAFCGSSHYCNNPGCFKTPAPGFTVPTFQAGMLCGTPGNQHYTPYIGEVYTLNPL